MPEIKITASQLGDLLDETNALKRAVHELFERGECSVRDLVEMRFLARHLIRTFNFYPQKDPQSGEPSHERDFVFSSDPRAFPFDDEDDGDDGDDGDDSSETNGDLH